jgi:hypothetical protein
LRSRGERTKGLSAQQMRRGTTFADTLSPAPHAEPSAP